MDDFSQEVASAAEDAEAVCDYLGAPLDYSEASLGVVDAVLAQTASWDDEFTPEGLQGFASAFGCYILEVGRREFGGRYCWFVHSDRPVLVVGEPVFRIALLVWDKVRGRLSGNEGDAIPFFYAGFAERVRPAKPGDDALYV